MIRPGEAIGPSNYHRPYLALIFDLDGTLLDSPLDFPAMRKAVVEEAHRAGLPPGELHLGEPVPKLLERAVERLHQLGLSEGAVLRFVGEVNRRLDAIEMSAVGKARPISGAQEVLEFLASKGFRLGVLTRSSEGYARTALHGAGVLALFTKLRTRNDSGPVKPDPRSLLILLQDMGVGKDRALFIGDGPIDLECAKAAGVDFVGLVHPTPSSGAAEEELKRKGAFRVFHAFPELQRHVMGTA